MIPVGFHSIAKLSRSLTAGILTLVILGVFSSLGARSNEKDDQQAGRKKHPTILLTASPAFGFAPLNVQLVATLKGVDTHDTNFCHAGVTWIRVDPGAAPEPGSRLSEDPRCVHDEGVVSVPTTFSKSFEIYSPGAYLYRLLIDGKDGTQIRSNYVKVQVLRIP